MSKSFKGLCVAASALALACLPAAAQTKVTNEGISASEIVIGTHQDLSGPIKVWGVPVSNGMATDRCGAVVGAELDEIGIIDNARDYLSHVDRALVVHRHDAKQFFRIMARLAMWRRTRCGAVPFEAGHDLARDTQGVAVVLGQIVA